MDEGSRAALVVEGKRLARRPERSEGPPELACFDVRPAVPAAVYAQRMREVLAPTLTLAAAIDFDAEELPTGSVPSWFLTVSAGGDAGVGLDAPAFARAGLERYLAHPGTDGPWEWEDWLSRFEPEFGMRGWAWWDLTAAPEGEELRIWVDSGTEPWFAHLDLLWLAYTAGASAVALPQLRAHGAWASERESP
ncbi:hypothetical protein SAMN06297387_101448 [Streptomyces zhaozhouensis]|uniref:Uncharacterized protein n=1 Tax=Streptomyces zhaozhouensis TaxID=1300267 RepID=A0A286DKB4_9ACTN|nr:hypothetical protein [Streptomyces zhaozhouensis]SOD59033.1 hypothetical protein SAMN06297387_101448 [Streptomyces zhaozhouensis]